MTANNNRKGGRSPFPRTAMDLLRILGTQVRVARRLGVSRSMVCRVLNGEKTSRRVRVALLREASRLAKLQGLAVALEFEEAAKR